MPEVDPRTEADAQIARAFQIVVDASDDHASNDAQYNQARMERRHYTPDELETLFFALGMAMVQLKKLAGGVEARNRFYDKAREALRIRGRRDMLDELDAEAKIHRIVDVLDELGVPRQALPGEDTQPVGVEARVRWLGNERDRLRSPARDQHRRDARVTVVSEAELTAEERAHAHPAGAPGMWEVVRWEDSDAVKVVRRALGDNVDLGPGTTGDLLVRLAAAGRSDAVTLRQQLMELARQLDQPAGRSDP